MPSTFALAPIPIWLLREDNGKPASGAIMYARSTLDHDIVKNVFQTPDNTNPWPLDENGGIVFRGNGTQGPFYWEDNGVDLYYLEFWTENGQFLDSIEVYPVDGGGGSTPITTIEDINNFIVDGQFAFNRLGANTIAPIPVGTTDILPIYDISSTTNIFSREGGWFFVKNVTGNTDSISIPQTSLSAASPDSNPRNIFTYSCTVAGTGTELDLLYITNDVKTYSNEQITFRFSAMASGSAPIGVQGEIIVIQNFGTGGAPSAQVTTLISFVWPTSFTNVPQIIAVPSVAGMSRGTNNDDYFAIGIRFPIGATGVYQVTNAMGVRGTVIPTNFIYDTQVETLYKISPSYIASAFLPTGAIIHSWAASMGPAWAAISDITTFGKSGSAGFYVGNQYFNVYVFLWNNLADAFAPVSTGRGLTALADWNALKTIRPPLTGGRVLANVQQSGRADGEAFGENDHTLLLSESPSHNHPATLDLQVAGAGGPGNIFVKAAAPSSIPEAHNPTIGFTGGGAAHNNVQPTNYLFMFIKL